MLEAVCPNGHRLQVPLEHAGMKLRCPAPGCGIIFQLSAHSPSGGTVAVGPGASGPGLPQTAPAPQPPAPPPPPAPAPSQPQSSQTYANVPLSSAPTTTAGDGGRWAGTEPATAPAQPGTSQSSPQINAPQVASNPRVGGRALDLSGGAFLGAAQAILMLGLVLVLAARGCDSLGARNVVRLTAKLAQEQQTFNAKLADELAAEPDAAKQAKLRESQTQQKAAQGKVWTTMQNAVNEASSANLIWGYWREMMFVVGTILLSLGLMAVAFVGQGVERYLSFGLLAIIVFSIYIGGAAWLTSLVGGMQGMIPGR